MKCYPGPTDVNSWTFLNANPTCLDIELIKTFMRAVSRPNPPFDFHPRGQGLV